MLSTLLGNHAALVSGVSAVVALVAFLIGLWALFSGMNLRRRFRRYKGVHSSADLEEVYDRTVNQVAALKAELEGTKQELHNLRLILRKKVSTPQVLRYNAFDDLGSDLSFSVALLDEDKNGVVLSSIYGRQESRTYAKPVSDGQSEYTLTDEEIDVIHNPEVASRRRPLHA